MTTAYGQKKAGPGRLERLKDLGARAAAGTDRFLARARERIADLAGEGTSEDFYREVHDTTTWRPDIVTKEPIKKEELPPTIEVAAEEEPPPLTPQLPAVVSSTAVVEHEERPRLRLPYFGIEHFKPSQIAQLFADGVRPQPFDPTLSYRIRSYSPPVGTVLHFVFERVNKALGQHEEPVRLILLQPVKTAEGHDVPIVRSKEPITSVCMYLPLATPWMEIRPVGPRIHEAGVDLGLGQPAVIKIKPPDLEKGFFEPYVEFLHDRRRPVRLGALLENEYMDGKSAICPLSQIAKNYQEAQGAAILAVLPKVEIGDGSRPPVYEPFPIQAQPPPRPRRVRAVVVPPPPEPVALPPPEQAARKARRRGKTSPSAGREGGPEIPPTAH